MAVDWTDPCARAEALRAEYYTRLSGASATRVVERAGDNSKEVWLQQVDMSGLLWELRTAEAECAAASGTAPRRFAIRAGSARF